MNSIATLQQSKGVTKFAAVSHKAALALKDIIPDVSVIWNGVDEDRLHSNVDKETLRRRWGGDFDSAYDYYVGYLGRLANEKNLDSIIYAVAALPYHYKLVLIGSIGWSQERVLTLARTLLPGRLIEYPPVDDVGTPLKALNCLVSASPREGAPFALIEGILCKIPVISTNVGIIPELNAMSGRELVELLPNDPTSHEIASAVRKICTNSPVSRTEAAYSFAHEHLTATKMCVKWEQYLFTALGSASANLGRSRGGDA